MSNNKQIEFDFSKWGQEGISVDDSMGRLVIRLYDNPIKDEFYGVVHDGCVFALPKEKLTMYEEIKLREIWVNEYELGIATVVHNTIEAAKKAADRSGSIVRQVKFIEVIEGGNK